MCTDDSRELESDTRDEPLSGKESNKVMPNQALGSHMTEDLTGDLIIQGIIHPILVTGFTLSLMPFVSLPQPLASATPSAR